MKKRGILALALAVLMAAAALGGCGQEAASVKKEPVTLKVWESDGVEKQFIEEMAKSYMAENPHVTIIVEPVSHTDAAQRLQLDGPAGVGADVFAAPHDKLGEMIVGGLILENTNADKFKGTFVQASLNATTYNGKLYGYPTAIET